MFFPYNVGGSGGVGTVAEADEELLELDSLLLEPGVLLVEDWEPPPPPQPVNNISATALMLKKLCFTIFIYASFLWFCVFIRLYSRILTAPSPFPSFFAIHL